MNAPLSARPGFTLLEVLIALAIVGIAISGAAAALIGLTDQTARVADRARVVERAANAEWMVRTIATQFDRGDAAESLEGGAESVTFASWCPIAPPDLEPCTTEIRAPSTGWGWFTLHMHRKNQSADRDPWTVQLWFVEHGTLRYLETASHGGVWRDVWSGITAPVALGIIMDGDTIVLRLGGDG
jgi:prepilin-type N-terminal cleavage/methylation domain-containing protein